MDWSRASIVVALLTGVGCRAAPTPPPEPRPVPAEPRSPHPPAADPTVVPPSESAPSADPNVPAPSKGPFEVLMNATDRKGRVVHAVSDGTKITRCEVADAGKPRAPDRGPARKTVPCPAKMKHRAWLYCPDEIRSNAAGDACVCVRSGGMGPPRTDPVDCPE